METKVLALIGDLDGCAIWRVLQPFTELQRRGYTAEWGYLTDPLIGSLAHRFDAVILPRLSWPAHEQEAGDRFIRAIQAAGIAVIYEVDDDMFSHDFYRRLYTVHDKERKEAQDIRQGIIRVIKMVDGVTVSSQRLATIVRQYTDKPVEVVENAIDYDWFTAVQREAPRQVKGLTIGWAGGIRPDNDVEQMAIAWGRVAEKHPHITFVVMGHQPPVIKEHVPAERIQAIEWLPVHAYPLGMVNIDIGCCPLTDTPFNRAKTWIKALEYGVSGAAVVASPTVYGKLIEDGVDGYIAANADEWTAALDRLVSNANHRQHITQRLQSKILKQHTLSANVLNWPVAWTRIVEDFRQGMNQRIFIPTRPMLVTA